MHMKTYLIFDLDGTLLDTIDDLANAVNYALHKLEFPTHTLTSYRGMVGNGARKLIERALPEDMRSTQIVDSALALFKEFYDEHCCEHTMPYPGIVDLLTVLTEQGVNLAVTSNKYQEAVSKIIAHYFPKINFRAVLGNRDGVPRKPDPSVVFEALLECPTQKSDVLYIGDSAVDMETAKRAGIESIGVSWGFCPVKELEASYADHIVTDPQQILALLG